MKRIYWKDIFVEGTDEKTMKEFLNFLLKSRGIPEYFLDLTPEITFNIKNKKTNEIEEIYIPYGDIEKYYE
ncbi:hypothetical protein J5751_05005 [bacterium]|nr:hypothetical protein [bacterium]